jgi:hypothetical protein
MKQEMCESTLKVVTSNKGLWMDVQNCVGRLLPRPVAPPKERQSRWYKTPNQTCEDFSHYHSFDLTFLKIRICSNVTRKCLDLAIIFLCCLCEY